MFPLLSSSFRCGSSVLGSPPVAAVQDHEAGIVSTGDGILLSTSRQTADAEHENQIAY